MNPTEEVAENEHTEWIRGDIRDACQNNDVPRLLAIIANLQIATLGMLAKLPTRE